MSAHSMHEHTLEDIRCLAALAVIQNSRERLKPKVQAGKMPIMMEQLERMALSHCWEVSEIAKDLLESFKVP